MKLQHTPPRYLFARLPVLLPVMAALSLPLASCTATQGAAAGALIGAGLGQMAGGDTEATLAGAAIGALVGGAIGYSVEKKREARVLASRRATEAELKAAEQVAKSMSDESRARAIAMAEAYDAEHADEYENPGTLEVAVESRPAPEPEQPKIQVADSESNDMLPTRVEPISTEPISTEPEVKKVIDPTPTKMATEETLDDEAADALNSPATADLPTEVAQADVAVTETESVLVEAVPLPSGEGHVLRDLRTGEFISDEVHVIDQTQDVSGDRPKPIRENSEEEPVPFTLILKDKETGKNREYTAIYSA